MSEENLKCIPVTDLIDLMVISVNELSVLHKKHDYLNMGSKNKEVRSYRKLSLPKELKYLIELGDSVRVLAYR
jgi:hypothetical protein